LVWYDLTTDTIAYKGRLMADLEALRDGSANVYTTAERLALTPTIGTMAYDASMTTLFIWDGLYWVATV
jgi:hypothetical protein